MLTRLKSLSTGEIERLREHIDSQVLIEELFNRIRLKDQEIDELNVKVKHSEEEKWNHHTVSGVMIENSEGHPPRDEGIVED
jgi:hypothetical protein